MIDITTKLAQQVRANGWRLRTEDQGVRYEDKRVGEIALEQQALMTRVDELDHELIRMASDRVIFFKPVKDGFQVLMRTDRGEFMGRHIGVLCNGRVMVKDACRKYAEKYVKHLGHECYIDYSALET